MGMIIAHFTQNYLLVLDRIIIICRRHLLKCYSDDWSYGIENIVVHNIFLNWLEGRFKRRILSIYYQKVDMCGWTMAHFALN